jgi:hypothetical protein
MRQAHLPAFGVALLRAVEVGDPMLNGVPGSAGRIQAHCRIVSYVTEMPRAASISSIMRRLNGKREYSHSAYR